MMEIHDIVSAEKGGEYTPPQITKLETRNRFYKSFAYGSNLIQYKYNPEIDNKRVFEDQEVFFAFFRGNFYVKVERGRKPIDNHRMRLFYQSRTSKKKYLLGTDNTNKVFFTNTKQILLEIKKAINSESFYLSNEDLLYEIDE